MVIAFRVGVGCLLLSLALLVAASAWHYFGFPPESLSELEVMLNWIVAAWMALGIVVWIGSIRHLWERRTTLPSAEFFAWNVLLFAGVIFGGYAYWLLRGGEGQFAQFSGHS